MVDVNALNMVLWGVLISCAVVAGAAALGILSAWLVRPSRRAGDIAGGIRAAEAPRAEAARDRTASSQRGGTAARRGTHRIA